MTAAALAAALVVAASVLAFSAMPGLLVWVAFIGWASYDHSGATPRAALLSSAALVFDVAMAWAVALVVAAGTLPLNVPWATAITAIASFLIVLTSAAPILSVVPARFYGFASTFAYLSLVPGAFTISALTALKWENAIVALPISLLIGTGLGLHRVGWRGCSSAATPLPSDGLFASIARPSAVPMVGRPTGSIHEAQQLLRFCS
jgi:hypothetical protein